MTMTTIARRITGGVDTHLDVHVAAALDQMRAIVATAPDELRGELRDLSVPRLLERCSSYRPALGARSWPATALALDAAPQRRCSGARSVAGLGGLPRPCLATRC